MFLATFSIQFFSTKTFWLNNVPSSFVGRKCFSNIFKKSLPHSFLIGLYKDKTNHRVYIDLSTHLTRFSYYIIKIVYKVGLLSVIFKCLLEFNSFFLKMAILEKLQDNLVIPLGTCGNTCLGGFDPAMI